MPTTPPPPTPLHGPQYDNYVPYSPRRSTRSTAQRNSYSSLNADRSPKHNTQRDVTPPPTVKRARFARQPTQFSSPPSSPASPVRHRPPRQLHKTPRKSPFTARKVSSAALSDSDHASSSLAPPNADPSTMLPTPSKTPKKRQAALHTTARILNFQPGDLNDVMPSSRKVKKAGAHQVTEGFELYDDEVQTDCDSIQIFTDANARVPEMDEAEDNPFIGRRKNAPRPQRRGRKSAAEQDANLIEAARNDEGVVYVFRGKKIFRKFQKTDEERASSATTDHSDALSQRRLRRQAGAAAQRPLTRSAIKPRLLFPSEEPPMGEELNADDVDEEAVTDIEMPNASSPGKQTAKNLNKQSPPQEDFKPATPPPTTRATRSTYKKSSPGKATPIYQDDPEPTPAGTEDSEHNVPKRKTKSPFELWPRTKAGRKRTADAMVESAGGGKRTRAATAAASPA